MPKFQFVRNTTPEMQDIVRANVKFPQAFEIVEALEEIALAIKNGGTLSEVAPALRELSSAIDALLDPVGSYERARDYSKS